MSSADVQLGVVSEEQAPALNPLAVQGLEENHDGDRQTTTPSHRSSMSSTVSSEFDPPDEPAHIAIAKLELEEIYRTPTELKAIARKMLASPSVRTPLVVCLMIAEFFKKRTKDGQEEDMQELYEFFVETAGRMLDAVESDKWTVYLLEERDEASDKSAMQVAVMAEMHEFLLHPKVDRILGSMWNRPNYLDQEVADWFLLKSTKLNVLIKQPYEYWRLPSGKFILESWSFIVLLANFTWVCFDYQLQQGGGTEQFTIAQLFLFYQVLSHLVAEVLQVFSAVDLSLGRRILFHFADIWNVLDGCILLIFIINIAARFLGNDPVFKITLVLNSILLWSRVSYIFQLHPVLGPLLLMARKMMKDIMHFILLAVTMLTGFSFALLLLADADKAVTIEGYERFSASILTLWMSFLGDFDFAPLESLPDAHTRVVALIVLCAFLILGTVLLVNLVVAMMAKTYEKVMEGAKAEYQVNFALTLYILDGNPDAMPPPLNLIAIILWICCLPMVSCKQALKDMGRDWYCHYCQTRNADRDLDLAVEEMAQPPAAVKPLLNWTPNTQCKQCHRYRKEATLYGVWFERVNGFVFMVFVSPVWLFGRCFYFFFEGAQKIMKSWDMTCCCKKPPPASEVAMEAASDPYDREALVAWVMRALNQDNSLFDVYEEVRTLDELVIKKCQPYHFISDGEDDDLPAEAAQEMVKPRGEHLEVCEADLLRELRDKSATEALAIFRRKCMETMYSPVFLRDIASDMLTDSRTGDHWDEDSGEPEPCERVTTYFNPLIMALEVASTFKQMSKKQRGRRGDMVELASFFTSVAIEMLEEVPHFIGAVLLQQPDHRGVSPFDLAIHTDNSEFLLCDKVSRVTECLWGEPDFMTRERPPRKVNLARVLFLLSNARDDILRLPVGKYILTSMTHIGFVLIFSVMVFMRWGLIKAPGADRTIQNVEAIFWFMCVAVSWQEVVEMRQLGLRNYLGRTWNRVDAAIIPLSVIGFACRIGAIRFPALITWYPLPMAALAILLWFRMAYISILDQELGPLLRMIELMFVDVFTFAVFSGTFVVGFAFGAYVLFKDVQDSPYDSFGASCRWFFSALLGEFDYDGADMLPAGIQRTFGMVVITVFLALGPLVLLNLLIAMMATSYGRVQASSKGDHCVTRALIIRELDASCNDLPPPLNIISYLMYLIVRCASASTAPAQWKCKYCFAAWEPITSRQGLKKAYEALGRKAIVRCQLQSNHDEAVEANPWDYVHFTAMDNPTKQPYELCSHCYRASYKVPPHEMLREAVTRKVFFYTIWWWLTGIVGTIWALSTAWRTNGNLNTDEPFSKARGDNNDDKPEAKAEAQPEANAITEEQKMARSNWLRDALERDLSNTPAGIVNLLQDIACNVKQGHEE